MELSIGKVLVCPSGTPNMPDKHFEMSDIYTLEARQQEIATVNKANAAELMQAFIDGYGATSRAYTQLKWELVQANKYAEERKGIVYLEVAPKLLQERGLVRAANPSGSEDQRRSVLSTDKEYLALQDRVAMIEAAIEFLHHKMKGFEWSYQSVKKVYDNLSSINALTHNKSEFNMGTIDATLGKPRY